MDIIELCFDFIYIYVMMFILFHFTYIFLVYIFKQHIKTIYNFFTILICFTVGTYTRHEIKLYPRRIQVKPALINKQLKFINLKSRNLMAFLKRMKIRAV